jgi:hypothetical protein
MQFFALFPAILLLFDVEAITGPPPAIDFLEDALKSNERMNALMKNARAADPPRDDLVKTIKLSPPSQNLRSLQNSPDNALHSGFYDFSKLVASARYGLLAASRAGNIVEPNGKSAHDGELTRLDTISEAHRSMQSCPLTSATPTTIDPDGVVITGTTTGAPSSDLLGSCGASGGESGGSPTVWYSFSTAARATIVVTSW